MDKEVNTEKTEEQIIKELSENGAKEVKLLSIKDKDKTYKAIIVMDFALYKKAYSMIINPQIEQHGKQSNVSIDMDMLGAGDKILFMGWHSGDEEIRSKMRLRAKAGQILGSWLMELSADDEEEISEKKS